MNIATLSSPRALHSPIYWKVLQLTRRPWFASVPDYTDFFPLRCAVCCHSLLQCHSYRAKYQKHRQKVMDSRLKFAEQRQAMYGKMKDLASPFKENIFTIPNLLCVIRIGLTPYVGYLVVSGQFPLACGVFAFAGFTDLLDGFIARRFPSQRSMAGSFLDPLADKFLVTTLVLTLTIVHLIPVPLTSLIVFRDVCLVAAACVIRYQSLAPPVTVSKYFDVTHASANLSPTTLSKYNTGVQLLLVLTTLAAPVFGYVDHPALHYLWYATAASTLISGFSYMFQKDTYKYFRRRPSKP